MNVNDADETELTNFIRALAAESASPAKSEAEVQPLTPQESSEPTGSHQVTMNVSFSLKKDDVLYVWRQGRRALQWTTDIPMDWYVASSADDVMDSFWVELQEIILNYFGERPTISTPHQP